MNKDPYHRVSELIMAALGGHITQAGVRELVELSLDHDNDCALGSVPACTCGMPQANNFLLLLRGSIRGETLVR